MPLVEGEDGDDDLGRGQTALLSNTGGLTQSGAIIKTLWSGAAASKNHWHRSEDELVHTFEGGVTLVEGEVVTLLNVGQTACFKAGTPVGHHLENCAKSLPRYPVMRTRSGGDVMTRANTAETVTIQNIGKVYHDGAGKMTSRKSSHGVG
jgi:uncharacterized cupin superfamily protein